MNQEIDSLAKEIAEALCEGGDLSIRLYASNRDERLWQHARPFDLIPIIAPKLAPLVERNEELVKLGLDQTKLIAQQYLDLRQAESRCEALRGCLKGCVEGLRESAKQKRLREMDDDERHDGDFEYAYDRLVSTIREVLEAATALLGDQPLAS